MKTTKKKHNCKIGKSTPVKNEAEEVKNDYGEWVTNTLIQNFKDIAP